MDRPEKRDTSFSSQRDAYQKSTDDYFSTQPMVSPDQFLNGDDSPYLGFDIDGDGDDQFNFSNDGQLMGDFPGDDSQVDINDLHEKRKNVDDKDDEDDDGGGKRREGEGGTSKKPGRKPLTAEPTSVCRTFQPFGAS